MQACVEVWESDPAAYAYNPVGYIALGASVQEADLDGDVRAPGADRLPLGADRRRGRGGRAHEGALPRLARARRDRVPARAPGRVRVQPGVRATGCAGKCRAEGVSVLEGVEVTGFEDAPDGSIVGGRDVARARSRSASRSSIAPGPWAKRFWALLGLPETIDVHTPSGDVVRDRPMWTYWNLQEGEVDGRSAVVRDRRRRRAARDPSRHRRAAVHRRRRPRDRRAVGDLLQARPPLGAGRRVAARRRRRRRARPVPADDRRRPVLPGPLLRRALARDERASRAAARGTGSRARAASARSPPTTSRCSTTCGRTCTRSSTRTTGTR